jgi:DNA-binding IclR family transcriptional regulator
MENKIYKAEKIKSIKKALDLLELLSDNEEMGITEISKELHIGISTVYRILTTLKCCGYVIQNQKTSKYTLGINLFILGGKVRSAVNLVELVTPFLQKLSQYTNESINFAILEGREAICLSKIESLEALRTDIKIGARLPTYCTAIGKALLAFLPEWKFNMLYGKDNKKLNTFTPNSISSVMELKKCLKKIKKDGYAIDKEEFKIGINCLGVPLINNEGKLIAGISITGPSSRFNLSKMKKLKKILISISKDISNQLNSVNIL